MDNDIVEKTCIYEDLYGRLEPSGVYIMQNTMGVGEGKEWQLWERNLKCGLRGKMKRDTGQKDIA